MKGEKRDRGEALLVLGGLILLATAAGALKWAGALWAGARRVEKEVEKTIVEKGEDVDLATAVLDYIVENYAPEDIKKIWESLTPEQKSMIAATIIAKAKEGIPAIQDALGNLASQIGGAVAEAINWLKENIAAILATLGIGAAAAAAAGGGWAGVAGATFLAL